MCHTNEAYESYGVTLMKHELCHTNESYDARPNVACSKRMLAHDPPAPMNHVKMFKGWPLQDAPSMLIQLCYKSFPPGRSLSVGNEEANYVE